MRRTRARPLPAHASARGRRNDDSVQMPADRLRSARPTWTAFKGGGKDVLRSLWEETAATKRAGPATAVKRRDAHSSEID